MYARIFDIGRSLHNGGRLADILRSGVVLRRTTYPSQRELAWTGLMRLRTLTFLLRQVLHPCDLQGAPGMMGERLAQDKCRVQDRRAQV